MVFLVLFMSQVWAFSAGEYYLGASQAPISLQEIATQVRPGDIVILGEEHNQKGCAEGQLKFLRTLKKNNLHVNVGMEFLDFTQQGDTDSFRGGKISESEFLNRINWGGFDFSLYREQILFPDSRFDEELVALNAPRFVTSQIARGGLDSLTEAQKGLLPPDFQKGRLSYFERFVSAIGHIKNPDALDRYFLAQSLWDDTMAYQALRFLSRKPQSVLVIIVGEFHSQYGGGLPDRILARGYQGRIWTISQLNALRPEEMLPSSHYGERASFIYLW